MRKLAIGLSASALFIMPHLAFAQEGAAAGVAGVAGGGAASSEAAAIVSRRGYSSVVRPIGPASSDL